MKKLAPDAKVYFMGIAGTGMAAVAGLLKEMGYTVTGSDQGVYPPMSTLLSDLEIPVFTPYAPSNLQKVNPDLVVVANALSRGQPELEEMIAKNIDYTSFPEVLGELVLKTRHPIVISGTHGKTTTTSLLASVLDFLGEDPGFFIGGIPLNFSQGFRLGKGKCFVLEGDEYDTAFFDKNSKFLHYRPQHLLINNIEYDHADIFPDLAHIEVQFQNLIGKVADKSCIVGNRDDEVVFNLGTRLGISEQIRWFSLKNAPGCETICNESGFEKLESDGERWYAKIENKAFGPIRVSTKLVGDHNIANICAVITILSSLVAQKAIAPCTADQVTRAIESFRGVRRRFDLLFSNPDFSVYEDFAHHPTAVRTVLEGFRKSHPKRRLIVAFEPKNATSRRNIFEADYVKSLGMADLVFIGACPDDKRIPADQKMDTSRIAKGIGDNAWAFGSNEELLAELNLKLTPGDAVIFMSSGSFSGIQHELKSRLLVTNR